MISTNYQLDSMKFFISLFVIFYWVFCRFQCFGVKINC